MSIPFKINSLTLYISAQKRKEILLNQHIKIQSSNLYEVRSSIARRSVQKNQESAVKREEERAAKIKLNIYNFQTELKPVNQLLANPHKMAQDYVDSLSIYTSTIDLSREDHADKRIMRIPDLSRFCKLNTLYLSFQDELVEGFETLPTSLKRLVMYNTRTDSTAEWLSRLVNLKHLDITNNSHIRYLPDLSGLTRLETLEIINVIGLTDLPCLPLNLTLLTITHIPDKYFTFKEYQQHLERQTADYTFADDRAVEWVDRINRINHFDMIRYELLSRVASNQ